MGGNDSAGAMRDQQQRQQNVLNAGQGQLDTIFGPKGGTIGTNLVDPTAGFSATQQYYNSLGAGVKGDDAKKLLDQGLLFGGSQQTAGFGQDFYNKRQQDYINYANPQLTQQFQQTNKNLDYSLTNAGLTNSQASNAGKSSLQTALAQQQQGVANQGLGQAQALQQQVGQEKNTLTNQLIASGNIGSGSTNALQAASQFGAPSPFAPVGNFFNTWTSLYGANQMANSYAQLNNPAMNPYLNNRVPSNSGALGNVASYR